MDEIIKILATKYGLTQTAVKAIIESPSRFIFDELKKEEFKNYNFEGFGKLIVKAKYRNTAREEFKIKKDKRDKNRENRRNLRRMEKSDLGRQGSGGDSQEEA